MKTSNTSTPIFSTRYKRHASPPFVCKGPSRTKSEMAKECDINNIVKKHQQFGALPPGLRGPGIYADVSSLPDYQTALDITIDAQRRFDSLPATTREFFRNDPGELLQFLKDPKNRDKAIELHLIPKPAPKPDPDSFPVTRKDLKEALTPQPKTPA